MKYDELELVKSFKYVVWDEYAEDYMFKDTLQEAKAECRDNIERMYNDGGGDSGCEQVIYERKGVIIGSMAVDIEEIWDEEEETVDTGKPVGQSLSG